MATMIHTASITVPDEELEGMTEYERKEYIIFGYLNIDLPDTPNKGEWDIQSTDFFLET